MPKIIRLDPHVANLIAAGEVVERPASVVKELIENSIDAGARTVTVEIQNGGMTFLRVTDDGCGMVREDAKTAFLRHATSKLRRREDLEAIGTLGFRGEALAATAAVSRVDLLTRVEEELEGTRLHLEAGKILECEDAGCPVGTTIIVRDLFYNTPARMKFMKRDSVEASAVFSAVQKQALAHPEISFRFLKDGAPELQTPGDGALLSAIYAVLGRQTAGEMVPVDSKWENLSVSGFVSKPTASRGTRSCQIFYVNHRLIRSRTLTAALEEAYRNQIMVGRFPACVLNLTVPLSAVDVNVHPAKTEVKFLNEREIFDCVHYGVKGALSRASGQVPMRFPEQKPTAGEQPERPAQPEARPAATPLPTQPAAARGAGSAGAPKPKQDFFRRQTAEEFREAAKAEGKPAKPEPLHTVTRQEYERLAQALQNAPKAEPSAVMREQTFPKTALRSELRLPAEETAQQTLELPKVPSFRYLGEALHTYLIVEQADEVILIDKHAAHERIRFDALKENPQPLMAQTLLLPLTVTLEADDYDAALQNLPALEQFGFQCEDFGGGTILLRAIPADIRMEDAAATVEELAHKLAVGRADPAAARDELLHTMACKSAIKAGMTTDPAEWRVLVDKVQSGAIQYCPHGRPVKYRLSRYEIEKFFKRA